MKTLPPVAQPSKLQVDEIAPVHFERRSEGGCFLDFGRAAFGTLCFSSRAQQASPVSVHLGEKLHAAGGVDRDPPGSVRYRRIDLEIPKGTARHQVVIPPDERNTRTRAIRMPSALFEVLPFRYAEIEAGPEVSISEPVQRAVFYPFNESASDFQCSDSRVNKVWDLCKYSIKATSFCGIYVDGDRERIPYEADAYINQLCHYGVDAEYEMARATLEHLLFHPTWPTDWALHFLPMAWADFLYTGRADFLATYYQELKWKALLPLAREDGLISTETGLVTDELLEALHLRNHPTFRPEKLLTDLIDWPPGSFTEGGTGERDNYDMTVPVKTVINAFHAWNLELLTGMAGALGKNAEAASFKSQHQKLTRALRAICFDESREIFTDGEGSTHASLHANMLPAAIGLVPPGFEPSVGDFIRSRGMACSVYGAQYLLEACYRLGMDQYALDLMTAEDDRGWLNMLRAGSSVTLEAWDHKYKNNLDWNHAWGAAPANIIPRFLVGVQPAAPGFSEIRVAPHPADLNAFEAMVPTPRGPVVVQYEKEAALGQLRVESPVPMQLVLPPFSKTPTHLPAGKHEIPFEQGHDEPS